MRIKEVSEKTGLTEKAIRLYIENGLIHPHVENGVHRNSYTFSEKDVRELEEISVFRKVGFSIFEISLIKEMPEKLPELLDKKRQSLDLEIDEKKSIRDAISRLEVPELGSVSQSAASLRPTIKKDDKLKESATLPYGSFKNVWRVGEEIDIAWKDTAPSIVYPLDKNWLVKKVWFYALVSGVSFMLFIMFLVM